MILFLGALLLVSFLITAHLVPWVMRMAWKTNFLDHPGPRKIHATPVPYGGGLAVAGGVLVTLVIALLAGGEDLLPRAEIAAWLPTLLVYGLGSLAILALGLVDDRRKLSARFKLGVQAVIATGVAVGGERLELFDEGGPVAGAAVTVLWILCVTNAFNLLDHVDGLSTGVAALSAGAFLMVALQTGQVFIAILLVPLIGACAGFLAFNFPPARIFLGDAGSLFIGFWLSCLTISFTFYDARAQYALYTYFVPLAVLAVPLFDTASVVIIRVMRRKPIFEGDTNHLAHRLTAMGMSKRRSVLTVYVLTLYAGVSAMLLYHVNETGSWIVLSQLILTFGIITLLEAAGRAHAESP